MYSITRRMFDFENMNLIPKFSVVCSRSECSTNVLGFRSPVVPANMECVINESLAETLARNGYFYVMHRFGDTLAFVRSMNSKGLLVSISIGVNEDSVAILEAIQNEHLRVDYITIDIAHGHCIKMSRMLQIVRKMFPHAAIIAGNVSTPEGFQDLEEWGADMIKVGVGPGYACTTYNVTGFGSRGIQANVIQECSRVRKTALLIADGGIQYPGDIAKCIVLGASFVMVGGMLSGFHDSPGVIVNQDGRLYKEFWGSASKHQSGKTNRIEGTRKLIPLKEGTLMDYMQYLIECLQSAISYGGGTSLIDLTRVKFYLK
jgi:GMP reductase